jgi:mannose-1-phosphate guanylyltransferase
MKICPVIIAGGVGTRFWPESRMKRPKQLLKVVDKERSLLELTLDRITDFASLEDTFIITSSYHIDELTEQSVGVPKGNIIAEPIGRNTAPCIALAAHILRARYGDDVIMVVLPADHLIRNRSEFARLIGVGAKLAHSTGSLVTLGIHPTRAETGYGYLQVDDERIPSHTDLPMLSEFEVRDVFRVKRFAEKPDKTTARLFVESGDFLWNSGMFIWRVDTIWKNLEQYTDEITEHVSQLPQPDAKNFKMRLEDAYSKIRSISIDYGVMEKATNVFVLRAGALGWSDVGSWDEVWRLAEKDEQNNVITGDNVLLRNSKNSFVLSRGKELIVLSGMSDTIVVDSGDAILITTRENAQNVKDIADYLKRHNQNDYL